ncbi:hypothetical protein PQX77_019694 [Marasmius sp. AFHP31]|nr:hypothetical protein PQX77_019694 [Marasmius sp. AFHP31]
MLDGDLPRTICDRSYPDLSFPEFNLCIQSLGNCKTIALPVFPPKQTTGTALSALLAPRQPFDTSCLLSLRAHQHISDLSAPPLIPLATRTLGTLIFGVKLMIWAYDTTTQINRNKRNKDNCNRLPHIRQVGSTNPLEQQYSIIREATNAILASRQYDHSLTLLLPATLPYPPYHHGQRSGNCTEAFNDSPIRVLPTRAVPIAPLLSSPSLDNHTNHGSPQLSYPVLDKMPLDFLELRTITVFLLMIPGTFDLPSNVAYHTVLGCEHSRFRFNTARETPLPFWSCFCRATDEMELGIWSRVLTLMLYDDYRQMENEETGLRSPSIQTTTNSHCQHISKSVTAALDACVENKSDCFPYRPSPTATTNRPVPRSSVIKNTEPSTSISSSIISNRLCVEEGKIELYFIKGVYNPTDMFMKNLGHEKFLWFRDHLGLDFCSST